ncbi:MAG: hypothetical protein ACSLFO_00700, partial [Acidimicrobiales bacterium]
MRTKTIPALLSLTVALVLAAASGPASGGSRVEDGDVVAASADDAPTVTVSLVDVPATAAGLPDFPAHARHGDVPRQ